MPVSDKTLERVAAREQAAEIERRRIRALRLAAAIGSVERGTPAAERLARGLLSASKGTRDGVGAVARKATKVVKDDTTPAVRWADRREVVGGFHRIVHTASDRMARRQAQQRAAIAGANAKADRLSKMRAKMRANQPGGEVWKTCTSRAQKKACKSRARAIARAIENGEY